MAKILYVLLVAKVRTRGRLNCGFGLFYSPGTVGIERGSCRCVSCPAVLVSYESNVSLKMFCNRSTMKINNSMLGNYKIKELV